MDRARAALAGRYIVQFAIVDDASPDGSWGVIQQQAAEHGDVRALRHSSNKGHNHAFHTGLKLCDGDWTVTIDDDLQQLPEDIPKLIDYAVEHDFDAVFGVFDQRLHASYRNLGSKTYLWFLSRVTGVPRSLRATSFRVLHHRLALLLRNWEIGQPQASYMIFRVTRNIGNLSVRHQEREHGQTGITLRRAFRLIVDSLVYFSTVPLRLAVYTGFLAFLTGAFLAGGYLWRYYSSSVGVAGFMTTVLLIISFGSANLLLTGVVGLYVARLMEEVVGRVPPAIRDTIGASNSENTRDE